MGLRAWRHFDFLMLLATLLLAAFGVAMIYSTTLGTESRGGLDSLVVRQIIFDVIGLVLLFALAATDYRLLRSVAPFLYGSIITALVAVQLVGRIAHGSQR